LLQASDPTGCAITSIKFHPDGVILATGTGDNGLKIWDLRQQKPMATFQGHKAAITAVTFSENGFYLASGGKDDLLKLWDLRGPKNIHTLKLDSEVTSLDYDAGGRFLAASTGSEIRVFTGKFLEHVQSFTEHTNIVTGVKWGKNAQVLASVSMDRNLKMWGQGS